MRPRCLHRRLSEANPWRRSQTSVPEHVVPAENVPSPSCLTTASGRIEIVLMHGPRVIVDTGVDAAALRRVLDVLERP